MTTAEDKPEYESSSTLYDGAFHNIPKRTWLPWVGQNYSERPLHKRLLVVGESHYFTGDTPEHTREAWLKPHSTREVVSESLINWESPTRTLKNITKLLFKTTDIDRRGRSRLWGDSAYYNFVQRPMDWTPGNTEVPNPKDYADGWPVFAEVVRIIQPSHCLFIGVQAANYFNLGIISKQEKIGGVWPRVAKLENVGATTELIFVHHLGRCRNVSQWHDYLLSQHPDFMKWLQAESYVTNQIV